MTREPYTKGGEFQYKIPPQNIEAEESLLTSILFENNTLLEILEYLRPDDFYRSVHQKIYEAMTDLFESNEPIDLITLTNHLKVKGQLDEIGGAAFLASLMENVPLAVNAPFHAKIVHEKACLRRMVESAIEIRKLCFDDEKTLPEIIDYAENAIFSISEDKHKESFVPLARIIDDNFDTLEERQKNKTMITGVSTGYMELDKMTAGLQGSDLIILAARPGMGKTSLALNIARNAAVESGAVAAVFSLEMSKEQLSLRLLCSEARVDSSRLRSGFFSDDDWRELTNAASVLSQAPLYINDSPDITALEIRAKARRMKMQTGLDLIIIDYIQLMKPRVSRDRRDLEISEISRSLKILAKELNVPVVALSQLNRKLEERSDKRPQLADLRESGALEQDADLVMFIYRDEVYNKSEDNPERGKAEIILAKQRNGPIGTVNLAFIDAYTRFENLATGYDMIVD